jgi:hypothetical protein
VTFTSHAQQSILEKLVYSGDKEHNKVYQYLFTGKLGEILEPICAKWQGLCHATDSVPAFGFPIRNPLFFSAEEIGLSNKMVNTYTHFARYGYVLILLYMDYKLILYCISIKFTKSYKFYKSYELIIILMTLYVIFNKFNFKTEFIIFDYRYPLSQENIEWTEYYTVNNDIIQPYYEFSNKIKVNGNYGTGLKADECGKLWKPYYDL